VTEAQLKQGRYRYPVARRMLALAALLSAIQFAPVVLAEAYPWRPIKFIVPFPAGGSSDLVGRTIARKIAEQVGQPVVVENRVGASGVIGQDALSRSPADGYTIGLGTVSTLAIAPSVHAKLPYDPLKSFAPVSLVARAPFVVAVHPSVQANSLDRLIDLARAKPGKLNFYSIGNGTLHHFAGEQFKALTGTSIVHVPYKGSAPALVGLLAGEVQVGFDVLSSFGLRNIESGKLKALAVAGPARMPQLPSVPTAAEAGLQGFEVTAWFGVVAPQGTPADVVARLNAEVQRAVASREARELLSAQGLDPVSDSPQQFAALIGSEVVKWSRIVKASGFEPE
jgi:tripartite-type tricarboxylate transporter receptor subunit TctC